MSVRQLARQLGCWIICDKCGAREFSALCLIRKHRRHFQGLGWARGRDRGSGARPKTTKWDLCPACAAIDHAAAKERHEIWRAARDAARRRRDAMIKMEEQP